MLLPGQSGESSSVFFALVSSSIWKIENRCTGTDTDGRDHNMRESFVVPVNSQRREMAGNAILYVCLITPQPHPYLSSLSSLPAPRLAIGISSLSTPSSPQTPPFETGTNYQFYTISSGFRLRTPMPPYLPSAERSRQRLVEGIRGLDVVKRRSVRGGGRHLLFFAYALAMQVGLLLSFFLLILLFVFLLIISAIVLFFFPSDVLSKLNTFDKS